MGKRGNIGKGRWDMNMQPNTTERVSTPDSVLTHDVPCVEFVHSASDPEGQRPSHERTQAISAASRKSPDS